jgi:hypothetical protein
MRHAPMALLPGALSGAGQVELDCLSGSRAGAYWWTRAEQRDQDEQRRNLTQKSQDGHL